MVVIHTEKIQGEEAGAEFKDRKTQMKTGTAHLPLHSGKAPAWLFQRMKRLARELAVVIVGEFGTEEMLRRLSDPFWFQAFGCVLGFDWHSSGLTTTVCGALKEGLRGIEHETGLFAAGGKGRVSRMTPGEIVEAGERFGIEPEPLVYASRMSAKVDSAAVQDGYQLYHHAFFFNREGRWAVVQQGMNPQNAYARRYHWFGRDGLEFVRDPHEAVCCDLRGGTLNLVAAEGEENRAASAGIASEKPEIVAREARLIASLELPARHAVTAREINSEYLSRILLKTYEAQPAGFEDLLGMRGVGPKTLRALSLLAEVIYGAEASFRDPARFSYAHGGKDRTPYPVDRSVYDGSIHFLRETLNSCKIENSEKIKAFKRLASFEGK